MDVGRLTGVRLYFIHFVYSCRGREIKIIFIFSICILSVVSHIDFSECVESTKINPIVRVDINGIAAIAIRGQNTLVIGSLQFINKQPLHFTHM